MITFPVDNILVADGDFAPIRAFGKGRPISIELSGVFGGATVALGFTSSDDTPVFIADVDSVGNAITTTTAGRWTTSKPASGLPALRVSGATGTTAILVSIVEFPR